ncbi:hypothetical protein [Flavobacterium sp.]|uniref:hypothetical protein n=1 Tax=Flavobacterium sp. TaxID=239 RepID=UPI003D0EDA9B
MKKLFLLATLWITNSFQAQVTTVVSAFTQNLTKNDLPFQGDRKMFATGINDTRTENVLVVSKNKSGAVNDELFIEKFTKTPEGYAKSFSTVFKHPVNKSLAFVNNRMMYSDADKDGNAEMLLVVDENEAGPESPLQKIWGVLVYKNVAYKLWVTAEDNFTETKYDAHFSTLPEKVKTDFLAFWNTLDKAN